MSCIFAVLRMSCLSSVTHQRLSNLRDGYRSNPMVQAVEGRRDVSVGLRCITCGLTAPTAAAHCAQHRRKKLVAGHELLLDTARNELFCSSCNDYVYSQVLDTGVGVRGTCSCLPCIAST